MHFSQHDARQVGIQAVLHDVSLIITGRLTGARPQVVKTVLPDIYVLDRRQEEMRFY